MGIVVKPVLSEAERFWAKVQKTDGCWIWMASRCGGSAKDGTPQYGRMTIDRRTVLAHRWSYVASYGQIPDGLTIDHLCRNKICVRPDHLEAVPLRINVLRSNSPSARYARQTHCKRGHPFDAGNTYYHADAKGTTRRHCRTCRAENNYQRYMASRQATLRIAA